ncbi:MAG TPA: DUF1800 domain-containing protein [Thermoanaerobaculia bacterium]|nr:DUF1800 domain-containing protein [Thermoanaerobaculia bacterium]
MASISWNRESAAHLYRRAAFGATAEEIDRALAEGLDATVARLTDLTIDNSALEQRLASLALDFETLGGIVRWWLTRMIFTARPLEERMAFFLHDHFATGFQKVNEADWMLQQNVLLRRFALGSFTELTIEISRDPAMLRWLDNFLSRKEQPNENYGRELLELFTLGHGNYTEQDVMSAARAFTGWTISRQTRQFVFVDGFHDHGQKTFLGKTGDWNGDDIVKMACATHEHAHFLARKLFEWFAYAPAEDDLVERLAMAYAESGTSLRALVTAILTSPEMYSERALWSRVKSPVEYAIAAARQLRIGGDPSRAAFGILAAQGQVLFNPPDVDGWPEGLAWINSGTILGRMNFAATMSAALDPAVLAGDARIGSAAQLVEVWLEKLGPLHVDAATRAKLEQYVESGGGLTPQNQVARSRGLAHLILSLPEWQMN